MTHPVNRDKSLSRRRLLQGAGALGCSLAASPFATTMTFAAIAGDARLVVIILRGAMDGLDVVQPRADKGFAVARPKLRAKADDLDGFFALNQGLKDLMPLWKKGELGFVHAVSTPYRDKRSHFDGQDMLEAGTASDVDLAAQRDGWLNRLLQVMPGATGETAFAIGRENMRILSGPAPVSNWAPNTNLALSQEARSLLLEAYHDDPAFADSALEAMDLAETMAVETRGDEPSGSMARQMMRSGGGNSAKALAAFAADRLNHESRIAAFSLNGWDTHRNQKGALKQALGHLSEAIRTLRAGLGANWQKTAVLAMTEFGRTVRENGTGGTDHGTAGVMLLAGGAIRGGRVFGRWPGLAEAELYQRRDLMPTGDVRAVAAWAMRDLFSIERAQLEGAIFPKLHMGENPGIIL